MVWVVSALIRTLAASEAEGLGSEEADLMREEREAVCTGAGLAGSVVVEAGAGAASAGAVAGIFASGVGAASVAGAMAICCGGVTGTVFGTALSATTGLVE